MNSILDKDAWLEIAEGWLRYERRIVGAKKMSWYCLLMSCTTERFSIP